MDSWNILKLLLHCLLANTLVEAELTMPAQSSHSPPTSNIVPNNSDNKFVTDFINCTDIGFDRHITSNTCYYYGNVESWTWDRCKEECKKMNARLTMPSTKQQQNDLIAYMKWRHYDLFNKTTWLGLYYQESQNKLNWLWVNGSTYNPESSPWNPKGPAKGEAWVRIKEGQWSATQNDSAEFYICEKDISPPNPTPHSDETNLSNQHISMLSLLALLAVPIMMVIVIAMLMKKRILLVAIPKQKDEHTATELAEVSTSEDYEYIDPSAIQDQYESLYLKITEGYGRLREAGMYGRNSGNTSISASNFLSVYPEMIMPNSQGQSSLDLEFQIINDSLSKHKKQEPNMPGLHRLFNKGGYSNPASVVNPVFSLDWKLTFITTKTAGKEFWQAVREFKSPVIVNLSHPQVLSNDPYYPKKKGEVQHVSTLEIKCNSVKENKCISQTELTISFNDNEIQPILHLSMKANLDVKSSQELQEIFSCIYEDILKNSVKLNHVAPAFLHCLDGAKWTGLFCAYSFVLDQIQLQNQIDIFQVVSRVRFCCNQFIATKEQYTLLYELIFNYMKTSHAYVNQAIQ